jgi:hypothetical protein
MASTSVRVTPPYMTKDEICERLCKLLKTYHAAATSPGKYPLAQLAYMDQEGFELYAALRFSALFPAALPPLKKKIEP